MLVVDASAMAELLLDTDVGRRVATLIKEEEVFAPQLLAIEVASVLRRWMFARHRSPDRAHDALRNLADLGFVWEDLPPLRDGIWNLRNNYSCYDASHPVLAHYTRTDVNRSHSHATSTS